MNRSDLLPYVAAILDDAGGLIRAEDPVAANLRATDDCVLVVFQCGFEPVVWAVRSALGLPLDPGDAETLAVGYLTDIGWFDGAPPAADFVLAPETGPGDRP